MKYEIFTMIFDFCICFYVLESPIKHYKHYSLARAYQGDTFFWGLVPQAGDAITISFDVSFFFFLFYETNSIFLLFSLQCFLHHFDLFLGMQNIQVIDSSTLHAKYLPLTQRKDRQYPSNRRSKMVL